MIMTLTWTLPASVFSIGIVYCACSGADRWLFALIACLAGCAAMDLIKGQGR